MNTPSDPTRTSSNEGNTEQSASKSSPLESQRPDDHKLLNDESLSHVNLDPSQTSAQTAALAAHLQRSGVMWLPLPDPHSVADIATSFPAAGPSSLDSESSQELDSKRLQPDGASPAEHRSTDPGFTPAAPRKSEESSQATQHRSTVNRPAVTRPASRLKGVAAIQTTATDYSGAPQTTEQRVQQLQQLEQAVETCTLCPALASCRNKTVFGAGNLTPRFAFFGEGPGEEEDLTGQPFVGRAGELLTKMMLACSLQREEVYILNTVKCRPPGNRNPEGDELTNCRTYYQQQFNVLRPEYIVCLGAVSAQELLGTKLSVGRLRGTLHRYFASKVLVTYHPAYLLRNPAAKKAAWADLQFLMRDAGIPIPKR